MSNASTSPSKYSPSGPDLPVLRAIRPSTESSTRATTASDTSSQTEIGPANESATSAAIAAANDARANVTQSAGSKRSLPRYVCARSRVPSVATATAMPMPQPTGSRPWRSSNATVVIRHTWATNPPSSSTRAGGIRRRSGSGHTSTVISPSYDARKDSNLPGAGAAGIIKPVRPGPARAVRARAARGFHRDRHPRARSLLRRGRDLCRLAPSVVVDQLVPRPTESCHDIAHMPASVRVGNHDRVPLGHFTVEVRWCCVGSER